ncbi:MAG: hypothetical protein WEC59_05895 [Salibacteraceae bacterium]
MKLQFILPFLFLALSLSCSKKESPEFSAPELPELREIKHQVLLEPTVSVSCGACPLAHHKVEQIEMENQQVNHISHYLHGPLYHEYTSYLIERINKTIYTPLSHVNRRHDGESVTYYPVNMLEEVVDQELLDGSEIGLEASFTKQEDELLFEIELFSHNEDLDGEYLVTVLLVERLVTGEGSGYNQRNYGNDDPDHPFYQQGDWIQGFEHTNVIRHVITPDEGEAVLLDEKSGTWSGNIDASSLSSNVESYDLIAFITKKADKVMPILNSITLPLNE